MKITLDYNDICELIKNSYNGVNDMITEFEDMEIILDVDSDKFSKRGVTQITNNSNNIAKTPTAKLIPEFEPGVKVDYETLILQKELEKESKVDNTKKLAVETHIPLVKTLEEKNEEARKKGLMVTGRTASRTIIKK